MGWYSFYSNPFPEWQHITGGGLWGWNGIWIGIWIADWRFDGLRGHCCRLVSAQSASQASAVRER